MKISLPRTIPFVSALCVAATLSCVGGKTKPNPQGAGGGAPASVQSTFQLPAYEAVSLNNGLQVLVIENHELPALSLSLMIREGASTDPMTKSGAANLMATVMGKGTATRTAAQIANGLNDLGSHFSSSVDSDYIWFQVSGLSLYGETILDYFSDVILNPAFRNEEVSREKLKVLADIRSRIDRPSQYAHTAFGQYLFGSHPYGVPETGHEQDVKQLKPSDLQAAYRRLVRPNNAVLIVTGDVKEVLKHKILTRFKPWVQGAIQAQATPAAPPVGAGVSIQILDKPDLTQSQIILGNMGINRADPDFMKLRVANEILGGSFVSRLNSVIRVKMGLTYGISSRFDTGRDTGAFQISTFTKNDSVGKTVGETLRILKQFCEEGVTYEEVEAAKQYLIGVFPHAIETPESLAYNLALLRLYGISADYLKNYIVNMSQITSGEVNQAIKTRMNCKDLKIFVLSNAQVAAEQLKTLGTIEIKKF